MGVVNVEQARIEEGVDAVAVVALEHISADIRKEEDKDSSHNSILAKILKAINVDYIDESQVLMPADQCYHINKDDFKVPFACGAKNLDEAFRRITESAAQENKNVVEAVNHMRTVTNVIKEASKTKNYNELFSCVRKIQAPCGLLLKTIELKGFPFVGPGIFKSGDPAKRAKGYNFNLFHLLKKFCIKIGVDIEIIPPVC
ncbi:11616_t:CDS:2 [Entrophospora sp. SA101]|nr:11616_t:CDS:2 [Entrophospora sp. SA101]